MTKRDKIPVESIALSIKGDLIPEARNLFMSVSHVLNTWEMPSGVVRNLQAAEREISKAVHSMHAALTVAELTAFGEED